MASETKSVQETGDDDSSDDEMIVDLSGNIVSDDDDDDDEDTTSAPNEATEFTTATLIPPPDRTGHESLDELLMEGAIPPPSMSSDLQEAGYHICDQATSLSWCALVRREIENLYAKGLLQNSPNRLTTRNKGGHLCEKVGVHELALVLDGVEVLPAPSKGPGGEGGEGTQGKQGLPPPPSLLRQHCPTLARWWGQGQTGVDGSGGAGSDEDTGGHGEEEEGGTGAPGHGSDGEPGPTSPPPPPPPPPPSRPSPCVSDMLSALNDAAPWLKLTHLDTMKVQYNDGSGGCFPLHRDSSQGTGRRLTCILYLEEDWASDTHGGEIRVMPFPLPPVDIAPCAGRAVLFSSVDVLHRVMPTGSPRCVVSLWFASDPGLSPEPFPSSLPPWVAPPAVLPSTVLLLKSIRGNQKHATVLTKILFASEFAKSIEDAFGRFAHSSLLAEGESSANDSRSGAVCRSTSDHASVALQPPHESAASAAAAAAAAAGGGGGGGRGRGRGRGMGAQELKRGSVEADDGSASESASGKVGVLSVPQEEEGTRAPLSEADADAEVEEEEDERRKAHERGLADALALHFEEARELEARTSPSLLALLRSTLTALHAMAPLNC